MIKGQDIVVLAALLDAKNTEAPYAELGRRARLSVSETHAAVRRLQESALVNERRRVRRRNVLEFLVHGLKYAFPMRPAGMMAKGMPTGYAAPVASGAFSASGFCPVWSSSSGNVYGQAVEPIYATAPEAAALDGGLYDRLALIDMLRGGRLRERQYAESRMEEIVNECN